MTPGAGTDRSASMSAHVSLHPGIPGTNLVSVTLWERLKSPGVCRVRSESLACEKRCCLMRVRAWFGRAPERQKRPNGFVYSSELRPRYQRRDEIFHRHRYSSRQKASASFGGRQNATGCQAVDAGCARGRRRRAGGGVAAGQAAHVAHAPPQDLAPPIAAYRPHGAHFTDHATEQWAPTDGQPSHAIGAAAREGSGSASRAAIACRHPFRLQPARAFVGRALPAPLLGVGLGAACSDSGGCGAP